jgi:hypothetical protein
MPVVRAPRKLKAKGSRNGGEQSSNGKRIKSTSSKGAKKIKAERHVSIFSIRAAYKSHFVFFQEFLTAGLDSPSGTHAESQFATGYIARSR